MKSLLMLLRQLGFDDAQSQVYMDIANSGPVTVLELSRSTTIKRTTVHFYVEQLLQKGLIVEGVRRGRRVLSAVSLEKLRQVVEEQKQQVAIMERSLEKVIVEMASSGSGDQSYGVGFVVEDGVVAIERVYRDAFECGEVVSYIDVLNLDGLQDIRMKLFADVALRQSLYSFKELYCARDPGFPDYAKKLKAFKPFVFTRTGVKLAGNVVNVLVFDKTVAIIVRDTEWKVVRLTQGIVAQLLAGMMEGMV
jgi:predicted transcriptional regulator